MKYILAAGSMLKRRQGRFLPEMYHFLCERYGSVVLYHRSCRKKPLFTSDVTVISTSEDSCRAYENIPGLRIVSFWELIDREQAEHFFRHNELPFPLKPAAA